MWCSQENTKKKEKKRKENLPQLHFHNKQALVEAPEEDLKTSVNKLYFS